MVLTFELRAAQAQDLVAVRALLEAASLPVDGLVDQFPAGYVLARAHATPIGAAGLEIYGESALLRSVVVAASARGSGIGAALVENRLGAARAQGVLQTFLLTTTAAGYFEKLGFVPCDRAGVPAALAASPEFAHACPASAACLWRKP